MSRPAISEADLCAYVDNEVTADRRAYLEAWLKDQPEAAARVENWRRQNRMIRAASAASRTRLCRPPWRASWSRTIRRPLRSAARRQSRNPH